MNLKLRTFAALALAASTFAAQVPAANASNHLTPPGIGLHPCTFNPGTCPPTGGGGGGGGGGSGGGLGPFGNGLVGGIGMGVGMGLVQGLSRPAQPQVIVQQPPVVVAPPPQPVSNGLSPHDAFCLQKYKSYNLQTKQYLSYSGQYKYCVSPHM